MTYRAIAGSETDPDAPLIALLMKALADNPVAIAERASGTPVMANGGWHPYDMVAIGDGATGLVYDFAVSGAVASVETPVFDDGFEYAIRLSGISAANNGVNLVIDLYKQTDAAYQTVYTSTAAPASPALSDGWIEIKIPRLLSRVHGAQYILSIDGAVEAGVAAMYDATVQAISKARVRYSGGNIDAGQVHLYRRGVQV
jgi:hypothetical protein